MADGVQRVRIEGADWVALLPFLRIFRSFRMALQPTKLLTALLLIVLLFLTGWVLDAIRGPAVYPDEIAQYASSSDEVFSAWRANREDWVQAQLHRQTRGIDTVEDPGNLVTSADRFSRAERAINDYYAKRRAAFDGSPRSEDVLRRIADLQEQRAEHLAAVRSIRPGGVFDTALRYEVDAFARFVGGAIALNLGVGELLQGLPHDRTSVVGALREMFFTLPAWLFATHPYFSTIYAILALLLWAWLGGAIARMAAVHATRGAPASAAEGLRFATRRLPWFVITPLIPVAVALGVALVLFLFGLVFFGIKWLHLVLDIVGGLLFLLPLLLGLVVALITIGLVAGCHLLYPAVAVDGADGFDANSRAYGYVVGRPWQLLFYTLVALVYGALTYLFVTGVVFLALWFVHRLVGAGASLFLEGARGDNRLSDLVPPPQIDRLTYSPDWPALRTTGKIAAVFTGVWVHLFVALLAAYAISYYFTAQTWIYLLLRRANDGTDFDDVYRDPTPPEAAAATPSPLPEKVEPAGPAQAT